MKLNYDNKGLRFQSTDIQEALLVSECIEAENFASNLTWHYLLTREPEEDVNRLRVIDSFRLWGLEVDGVKNVQNVLNSKRKKDMW